MGVFIPSQLFLLVLSTFLFIVNNSISILLKTSNTELEIIGFQFKEINSRNRRLANKAILDKNNEKKIYKGLGLGVSTTFFSC